MLAGGVPWAARRVGPAALEEIVRKVLLTYWNTASFFVMYANAAADADGQGGWTPERLAEAPPVADRPLTDRWALSELHRTIAEVDAALEAFDTARAGARLSAFVDDLSNWYVRRSRRRFWNGPDNADGASAFATLYECLETLTRLMAPFVPFITDYVWDVLRHPDAPESVHLSSWPEADPACVDERLGAGMALARRLVELGRAARADSGVRTRQPLGRAVVGARGFADLPEQLRAQVADELNVEGLDALATVGGELVEYQVKPNFRALGKRFAKRTPVVANAITAVDPGELAAALRASGTAAVTVDGEEIAVGPDDVIVTEQPRTGWAVAGDAGETVALDLEITPRLRRAGLAREVIRLVQDARKSDGLDITDRIGLWWQADDAELREAVSEHIGDIAGEVLAHTHAEGAPGEDTGAIGHGDADLGLAFWIRRG
jgi:isoleucyl-tRNA synthetase